MDLFIVIIAIAFLQVWGAQNPLHIDGWFFKGIDFLKRKFATDSILLLVIALSVPIFIAFAILYLVVGYSSWLMLPLGVLVLLYSFGRGEFSDILSEYTKACYIEDWDSALERAGRLNVDTVDLQKEDWPSLHRHVFDEAVYRGFERMFSVLFWFFVIGPIGALVYRLLFLFSYQTEKQNSNAEKLLWLMEWPAVRVLSLSFALTGNFVGCFQRLRECVVCIRRSTIEVLSPSVLGALSVDDQLNQTGEVTRKELNLMEKLYTRTLWLWLVTAAILILAT